MTISRWLCYFAPAFTFLGVAFVSAPESLSSALWSSILDENNGLAITLSNLVVWGGLVVLASMYAMQIGCSGVAVTYGVAVACVFILGLVPLTTPNIDLTAQTLSMLGIGMFFCCAALWKESHFFFNAVGRMISLQRFIPALLFRALVFAVFLMIAVFFSQECFSHIPGYVDSIAQYVQGKFIAAGKLMGQSPALPQFFPVPMSVSDGKWYAQYQPLHSLLLGMGHMAGMPWLVNPLEGALTAVVSMLATRRIFDETTARIAGVLVLLCSFMWFMSAEFMNHATALLCTTLLIYTYVEMLEAQKHSAASVTGWGVAAGLSLGALFLTRPLTAIGIGFPFIVHAAFMLYTSPRDFLRPVAFMAAAGVACLSFDLWYNLQTTGFLLLFPSGKYHNGSNVTAMGFGDEAFSWRYVLTKAQDEWVRLNKKLFEWWLPSTFWVMFSAIYYGKNRYVRLLFGVLVSHTIFNMANQFHSGVLGPRYLYELSSALIILSAAGIAALPKLARKLRIEMASENTCAGIITFAMFLVVSVMMNDNLPPLVYGYKTHFFYNHPQFYQDMLAQSKKPALIFVGRGQDAANVYKSVAFTNPPDTKNEVIFAIDRGDQENHQLLGLYPDRNAYVEYHGTLLPVDAVKP